MPPIEPIEAEQIEVVYERGVLRPLHPLDLEEGTRLEVTVTTVKGVKEVIAAAETATPSSPSTEQEQSDEAREAREAEVDETSYAAFLNELDSIAALPLQSAPQPHTVRNHDAILYPKQGKVP
jgi:predicted DNA-binding antitoxin AbrB/MazE fold protein